MKSLTRSVSKVAEYLLCSCQLLGFISLYRLCMIPKFTDIEAYADEFVFFLTI